MKVIVTQFMSLDGVVQAPGGPDEDTDGGFAHGGWSMPHFDPEVMGGGKSVFGADGALRALELVSVTTAATGVLVTTYRRVR